MRSIWPTGHTVSKWPSSRICEVPQPNSARRWLPRSVRGSIDTRPPSAVRRAAISAPHRSTAALSSVGDSILARLWIVSSSHGCSARQKSRRRIISLMLCALLLVAALQSGGQQQQPPPALPPFPKPAPRTPPATSEPAKPGTASPTTTAAAPAVPAEKPPTEAELGLPVYPGAQFIASYDAGRG